MDKIKVMALGGLDEEGKDLYVIEVNDDIFVINAGFKYPDKNTPGIDFIISDFSYLVENKHTHCCSNSSFVDIFICIKFDSIIYPESRI